MRVFISHSYDDKHIVLKVREYLINHNIEVFDGKIDILTGSNLNTSVSDAINNSDAVLFFISKNSENSTWVQQEISLAVSNRMRGANIRLIPILLDKEIEIPFFLKEYVYLDLSDSADFQQSMISLIRGLQQSEVTTTEHDLETRSQSLKLQKETLENQKNEYLNAQKYKTNQILKAAITATIISAIVISFGLLNWLTNLDSALTRYAIAFILGIFSSISVSYLFSKRDNIIKNELNQKINQLHKIIKELEARND